MSISRREKSMLGNFLIEHSISQKELAEKSGVDIITVIRLCYLKQKHPSLLAAQKVITTLRKSGYSVYYSDFWDI